VIGASSCGPLSPLAFGTDHTEAWWNKISKGDRGETPSKIITGHPEHTILNIPLPNLVLNGFDPTRVLVIPFACPLMPAPRVSKLNEHFAFC
jgi:hypothetical protein